MQPQKTRTTRVEPAAQDAAIAHLAALCAGRATHCIAIHARMPSAIEQARYWRESGRAPLLIRWSLHSGLKYEESKERYAPFNALVDEDPDGRAQIARLVKEAAHAYQDAYGALM